MGKPRRNHSSSCILWVLISPANKNETLRKKLIKQLDSNQMSGLAQLMQDLLDGELPLPEDVLKQLAADRKNIAAIETLANTTAGEKRKKKILRQNGGFLHLIAPMLLGPAIGAVLNPLFSLVGKKIKEKLEAGKKK